MGPLRFIGDIHANMAGWVHFMGDPSIQASIQVGDLGIGMAGVTPPDLPSLGLDPARHKAIGGNHDDREAMARYPWFVPDGTLLDGTVFGRRIFCVGGAASIDRTSAERRDRHVPGLTAWSGEEVPLGLWDEILGRYADAKPDVVVSHDGAQSLVERWFGEEMVAEKPTNTRLGLQAMLDIHRPAHWVFGHWHRSLAETVEGTRFILVDIDEAIDIFFEDGP